MEKSKYYRDQCKAYEKEANKYGKNIDELQKIKNMLLNQFYDEQSNVNKELNDLKNDLNKAVRHDSGFSAKISQCEWHKEKVSTADSNLKNAINALENEIATLGGKKMTAEQNYNTQLNNYNTAKQEEKNKLIAALTGGTGSGGR